MGIFFILVLVLIFLVLTWYCFIFEPYNFKVERLTIKLKNLPLSFEGVNFVQISDLHSKKFGRKEKAVLKIINKLNPEYIFITGDIIDSKTKDLDKCRLFWSALGKKYPKQIFAIFGNHLHENTNINVHLFKKVLQQSGINILVNENRKLKRGNEHVYLIGVDDPRTQHQDFARAMKGVGRAVKILLAHSPDIIKDIKPGVDPVTGRVSFRNSYGFRRKPASNGVDLILAGHTHGGQVRIPFVRTFWDFTKYYGKYTSGLFKAKGAVLYVNRGISTSILPIRFNASPEITLIKLTGLKKT